MSEASGDIERRASLYAGRRLLHIQRGLGFGKDGTVFLTDFPSAVKVHVREEAYARELACYRHLERYEVFEVCGFHVPQLISFDDELRVIEMTVVEPPFILDFASAYLGRGPDFSEEVMQEWREEKLEQFGGRWPEVETALDWLRSRLGIQLLDIHPWNVAFLDD
jgi:hypothetical protein